MVQMFIVWNSKTGSYRGANGPERYPQHARRFFAADLPKKWRGGHERVVLVDTENMRFNIKYTDRKKEGCTYDSVYVSYHYVERLLEKEGASNRYIIEPHKSTLTDSRAVLKAASKVSEDTKPKTPEDDGVKKYDDGKAPMSQGVIHRFPLALQQIALISQYGKDKYGTFDGWEKLPDSLNRYPDAGARHDSLRASEGEYDINDSGLPHRGQKAWNALAELELALRQGVIEMTSGNEIEDGKPVLNSNGRSND